jgi:hypothetical protein
MVINCEVLLRWDTTPPQQMALGNALWRWCLRASAGRSNYQYLDNQALADLLAGRLPASSDQAKDARLPYVFFTVPDHPARERDVMFQSLRLAIPSDGIADLRIDGNSWSSATKQFGDVQ